MRALAYIQFDDEATQDADTSQHGQEAQIGHFVDRHHHTLAQIFADPLGTASVHPEGLTQMFQRLSGEPVQFLVLVTDPTHLGSTPVEAVERILKVDSLGSRVVCTMDEISDPMQAMYRVLSAQGVGTERRRNIKEAMLTKALRGEGLGKPPYGYRIGEGGRFAEVPQEAEMVHLVFRLYAEEDMGLRAIASHVNQAGYRTRRGRNWSMVTLRDMLRNRAYIGTYSRFGLRLAGNHQPLVTSDVFRRVQDLMHSRTPRRTKRGAEPFVLSGLAYCISCGNRMMGVTRRQSWKRKDGVRMRGTYRYYQCQSRANQSRCEFHTWRAEDLENAVVEHLRQETGGLNTPHNQPQDFPQDSNEGPDAGESPEAGRGGWSGTGTSRQGFMRYLKQAADGVISLNQFLSYLNRSSDTEHGDAPSEAPGNGSIEWEAMSFAAKRSALLYWVRRVDVGDGEVRVSLHQPT
ncbi:MAG: recombinase family protein, partial [Chloroflexi bacterium]|nr:recombinase family protein [Chloroflexota bacterium]